ncbi:MAG: DUF5723 family protein [Balneolaceae bacterium]
MRTLLILLLLLCLFEPLSMAQTVITPRNMALGGGGSTYITDYNTNFYNPANLMIQDKIGSFDVGVMAGGFYFDAVQNHSNPERQFENAQNHLKQYNPGSYSISDLERVELLDDNYLNNSNRSNNRTRYDATLLGMKWKTENRALSLAFRTRTSSSYSVGRGWYSQAFQQEDGREFLDRTLIHRYQSLHEISFGYAESFQFLTNLTSRLDNFVIGIAPKLVFGGSYQDAVWDNIYYQNAETNENQRVQSFSFAATGDFGLATSSYLDENISAENAVSRGFQNDEFTLNGVGAGLDIGVTYLLTFGSDLSAVHPGKQPTQKSVRFSFSMTDIGFVSYSKNDISLNIFTDTTNASSIPASVSNEAFIGAKGQYLNFIETFGEEENPFRLASRDKSGFSILLPMALHGGALLEINRIKLMGDVSVGLTNNAFNSTTLVSSFGIELRPFVFLPLRAGTQFEAQRPSFLSLGTAIETKHWDLSVAAQFTPESLISEIALSGISLATLQFHF